MIALFCRILCLGSLGLAAPSVAQVIEIGSDGEARTFDGPTLFTADEAVSIERAEPAVASRNEGARALLASAAREQGIEPSLLEAVAWQESRGRMDAVSSKGAIGVMQLMPATAAELGVRPDDLVENIRGGALYLRRQIDRFKSVPLALAAYNAGPGAVLRYRGIPPYRETQNYVAKILARWKPPAPRSTISPTFLEAAK